MSKEPYIIIGAGIIGSTIAREIRKRDLGEVLVLEKENHFAEHASGRNSGVIHSGINPSPGTIKARMCVRGNMLLRYYCQDHGIEMNKCGTLVVSRNEAEEQTLNELLRRGNENSVPNLRIISKQELREREPFVVGEKALYSPTGAVVNSVQLLEKVVQDAKILGAEFILNATVENIHGKKIIVNSRLISGKHIINCAGLYADKIAQMCDVGLEYFIVPFRGGYKQVENLQINSMVYQSPDLNFPFLSVHLTKETDGKILAGPTAMLSLGRESYKGEINWLETLEMLTKRNFLEMAFDKKFISLAYRNARLSFSKRAFLEEIQTLAPSVQVEDLSPYKSGIRAQLVDRKGKMVNDMLIVQAQDSTHVLNAVSPGMTCSLAFAEYIVDDYLEH